MWSFDYNSIGSIMRRLVVAFESNVVRVIVDWLLSLYLIEKHTWSIEELADVYANEIVCLHDVFKDIMSDRDPRFL